LRAAKSAPSARSTVKREMLRSLRQEHARLRERGEKVGLATVITGILNQRLPWRLVAMGVTAMTVADGSSRSATCTQRSGAAKSAIDWRRFSSQR
jgi:hypothetical protein